MCNGTTSTFVGFFDQNLHQELLSLSLTYWGAFPEDCSPSFETSNDLSLQLRGTHPLLTKIADCKLVEE